MSDKKVFSFEIMSKLYSETMEPEYAICMAIIELTKSIDKLTEITHQTGLLNTTQMTISVAIGHLRDVIERKFPDKQYIVPVESADEILRDLNLKQDCPKDD